MCKLLEGKVCVITGGGQGVGLGIAQEFIEQGARVVITGRRQATLDEATATLAEPSHLDGFEAGRRFVFSKGVPKVSTTF
jgi:NAD(P)-dependent dehydrogenase (short-subunit alcohol dehydrogenase family)